MNRATAVAVDNAGNVAVTGFSDNTTDDPNNYGFNDGEPYYYARGRADYYTVKYAAGDGHMLWEKRYNGTGSGDDVATDVKMDGAGNVIVTGYSWNLVGWTGGRTHDFYTAKYAAADGQLLWQQRYQDTCTPGADYPRAIAFNSEGDVIIAGQGYDGDPNSYGHYHTVRLAAADGHLLWQANYVGPGNLGSGRDELSALAIDGSGNVIVTGYSQAASGDYFTGSFDYATVKYSPIGPGPGTITGPNDTVTSTASGQCSAVVNFIMPAATDECGNPLPVTCTPSSGSVFPKGTTTVNCSTAAGATCSFTVTVNDTESPTITCPANVVVHPPCGQTSMIVNYSAPSASDNCSDVTVTCHPPSGSAFPAGTTSVNCTARDGSGNAASCAFTVTVDPSASTFPFTGFLSPIGGADDSGGSFASPLRAFKLKSTIPVKFAVSCDGSPVLSGLHTLQAIKYSNQTTSDSPIDATPTDGATTGNQFRLTGEEWHFNLDTRATGMSTGIWLLRATLSDGSQHTAWIQIK